MTLSRRMVPALALWACASFAAAAPADRQAVERRLSEARAAQEAAAARLSAVEKDLVLFADFEQDDTLFLGNTGTVPAPLEKDHYRPGRFGRGYFFEKPRHNMLPAEIADIERARPPLDIETTAKASVAAARSDFGARVLSVSFPEPGARLVLAPQDVQWQSRSWHEKQWTLLASCFVKGPKDARLAAEVSFVPMDLAIPEPKAGEKKEERIPDASKPEQIVLTGEWQRIACTAAADSRLRNRRAVLALAAPDGAAAPVLMDGFQFEQAAYYPFGHTMPTSWTPGGARKPSTTAVVGLPMKGRFPVAEGTIAFWTSTPKSSNLTNQGGTVWISFGAGYNPGFTVSTYRCSAGGDGFMYFTQSKAEDGAWHHIAMAWDREKVSVYRDGAPFNSFERKERDMSGYIETCTLRIGGSFSDGQNANAVMDDIAIFRRRLSDDEVKAVASANAPLRATANALLFAATGRTVFFRGEKEAAIDVSLTALGKPAGTAAEIDCAIGTAVFSTHRAAIAGGTARIPIAPGRLACGIYPCRVGTLSSDPPAFLEFPVEIVPALRPDHYMLSSWGSGIPTADWRAFCATLGLNTIDTYDRNYEEMGRSGLLYGWHHNFGNGVWSPSGREEVRRVTAAGARERAPYPNWRYTLLNSEVAPWIMPDDANRKEWFDAWAKKELGFPVPEKGWKFGTTHNPIQCWFPDGAKPGPDGIYGDSREFRFLEWWYNRGCGWWRLAADAADEIKKLRRDVKVWTDPLHYPGQVADLDAGSTWSYQTRPEPLIGEFEESYAAVRGSGKEYYATLGMNYVRGFVENVTEPDGVKKNLAPTADDMIQQAWLSVAHIATEGITYWSMDSLFNGLRNQGGWYAEPGSDAKLGAVLKNDLLPVGTMLKGVPNAQRPLALLFPESTHWFDAGEGGWGWGTAHYPNHWKDWLGRSGIPYDIVPDNGITPGSLARYRVIVFPMAEYVSKKVFDEVAAAARAGTKVIVDSYCRQEYPNMERWPQEYYYRMKGDRKGYGEDTLKRLAALRETLLPGMLVHAQGADGNVIVNARETGGVLYVSVVNDSRRDGPYTAWTKKPDFQPYGKAQRATVAIKMPAGSAVYEFTESTKPAAARAGDRTSVTLDLPPTAGRLLCVYPAELREVRIAVPDRPVLGTAGAFEISILDARGAPAPGVQLIEATITDPAGRRHDESGIYRAPNGRAAVPFRPAVNDRVGAWKIEVRERTSGIRAAASFAVAAE